MQNNSEKIANKPDWIDYLQVAGIVVACFVYVNGIIHSHKFHNASDNGALDRYSTLPFVRGIEAAFHKKP